VLAIGDAGDGGRRAAAGSGSEDIGATNLGHPPLICGRMRRPCVGGRMLLDLKVAHDLLELFPDQIVFHGKSDPPLSSCFFFLVHFLLSPGTVVLLLWWMRNKMLLIDWFVHGSYTFP
jgi:hypothetical protein